MRNKITDTLLPVVKVLFYHGERKIESYFTLDSVNDAPSLEVPIRKARDFLATFGLTQADVSLYLIDKVKANGEPIGNCLPTALCSITPGSQLANHRKNVG